MRTEAPEMKLASMMRLILSMYVFFPSHSFYSAAHTAPYSFLFILVNEFIHEPISLFFYARVSLIQNVYRACIVTRFRLVSSLSSTSLNPWAILHPSSISLDCPCYYLLSFSPRLVFSIPLSACFLLNLNTFSTHFRWKFLHTVDISEL